MDIESRLDQQIALDPTDVIDLKIKKAGIDDQLAKAQDERGREMEMYLTPDEKALHNNAFRTHCENEQRWLQTRGQVYALIFGQCLQSVKDKIKEDADWVDISSKYDPIRLMGLIKKYVLKQTDSIYEYNAIIEETAAILNFRQNDLKLAEYNDKFASRVAIGKMAGEEFITPDLLESETDIMFHGMTYATLTTEQKAQVYKVVED
jgi:hypothetical protein